MIKFISQIFKTLISKERAGERAGRGKRNYNASLYNRLTSDWKASNGSADSEIQKSLKIMRARSRDLCINNDYARRFIKKTAINVIGAHGIRMQANFTDQNKENNKKTNNKTNEINKKIEEEFNEWSKLGNTTVCGKLSWIDCQRLFLETVARDGEVIVRLVSGFNNEHGFALQFIESDQLDEELNKKLTNGNYIRMGIEFNKWGKPIAYHIKQAHPHDYNYADIYEKDKYIRIKSDEIIHGYIIERPSQNRGVPWMQSAMLRLRMLGAYEEAELVASRVSASKMGFIVSPDGTGYSGDDEANAMMEASPGTFEQLPSGYDVRTFDPNHPSTSFASFEKSILRGIASGLDISYNTLANDLENVNFSSIRHGSLEDRDSFRFLQQWVINHFNDRVYKAWLKMAILKGKLKISPVDIDKYSNPTWRPRGWAWVDPLKENNANRIAIALKTKSRSQVAADQAMDIEELFKQLALEKELAKKYGLDLDEYYHKHYENEQNEQKGGVVENGTDENKSENII